jgi:hypothetical protein
MNKTEGNSLKGLENLRRMKNKRERLYTFNNC